MTTNNDREDFAVRARDRLQVAGVPVTAGLLGARHAVLVDQTEVRVELPGLRSDGSMDEDRLSMWSWREIDGARVAEDYLIHAIDLSVEPAAKVNLPGAITAVPPKATHLLADDEKHLLDRVIADAHMQMIRALDIWLRMARWKASDPFFGRGQPYAPGVRWSTRLADRFTGNDIWVATATLVLPGYRPISLETWDDIATALSAAEEPPVAVDLLFDGIAELRAGDVRRALVDAAVAAETYIRNVINESLPQNLGEGTSRLLEELGINRAIDQKVYAEARARVGLPPHQIASEVKDLFKARNQAVHRGKLSVTAAQCGEFLKAVEQLLVEGQLLRPIVSSYGHTG